MLDGGVFPGIALSIFTPTYASVAGSACVPPKRYAVDARKTMKGSCAKTQEGAKNVPFYNI